MLTVTIPTSAWFSARGGAHGKMNPAESVEETTRFTCAWQAGAKLFGKLVKPLTVPKEMHDQKFHSARC